MRMRAHGYQQTAIGLSKKKAGCDYGFMFPQLPNNPNNQLPQSSQTIAQLKELGTSMVAISSNSTCCIPAVYTYFGQFIDHDITATELPSRDDPIELDDFEPMPSGKVCRTLKNRRTARLDLDSVYDTPAPRTDDGRMKLGTLSNAGFGSIPVADREHDLPRRPLITDPQTEAEKQRDREALIGDERNDENLLIAQLHVAFLRAHNALMDRNMNGNEAQRSLRRRYQCAVLHDFIPTICDPAVAEHVLRDGPPTARRQTDPSKLFIPIEFATAAFRFGHSMVRQSYFHNRTFTDADFSLLFSFTALSGDLAPNPGPDARFPTLPDNWVIEWEHFLPGANMTNPARRIDPILAPELDQLRDFQGCSIAGFMSKLATRNLLRGYLFGLPTGQAVAKAIGATPLSGNALLSSVPASVAEVMKRYNWMQEQTPLWLYILAEAGNSAPNAPNGEHLGVVGSTIVAETLWNLVYHSQDSVLQNPPDDDEFNPADCSIANIIKLGVPVPIE